MFGNARNLQKLKSGLESGSRRLVQVLFDLVQIILKLAYN